jgi:hypothetical protein
MVILAMRMIVVCWVVSVISRAEDAKSQRFIKYQIEEGYDSRGLTLLYRMFVLNSEMQYQEPEMQQYTSTWRVRLSKTRCGNTVDLSFGDSERLEGLK